MNELEHHPRSDVRHPWLAFGTAVATLLMGVVVLMTRYVELGLGHQSSTIIERQPPPVVINQPAPVQPPPVVILEIGRAHV